MKSLGRDVQGNELALGANRTGFGDGSPWSSRLTVSQTHAASGCRLQPKRIEGSPIPSWAEFPTSRSSPPPLQVTRPSAPRSTRPRRDRDGHSASPEGFMRHKQRATTCPAGRNKKGGMPKPPSPKRHDVALRSGYPFASCSSAELASVSPDRKERSPSRRQDQALPSA